MDALFVFTTVSSEDDAGLLARQIVERRLAACVNLVPGVRSIYRWKDAVCDEKEVLLVIKTLRGRLQDLEAFLRERHPYELPEIVAVPLGHVEERFGAWIAASCAAS